MAIRISGLISGLDTDSIVQELVSAYSTKKENIEKKQTKLSWTQDAWKEMNTKIYGFYSKSLTEFKFMTSFNGMKKTTLSDSSKATVTAGASVVNGTQSLKINKLAKAAYLTGSKIKSNDKLKSSSKLSELGIADTELEFQVGDKKSTISVNGDMTIKDLTKALSDQGVTASFDETQQRFFINSQESGEEFDFKFNVKGEDQEVALRKLGMLSADYMVEKTAKKAADDGIQALRENATIKASAVQIAGITEDEFDALDETAQKEYLDAAIVKAYDTDNGITTGRDYTNKAYVEARLNNFREAVTDQYIEDLKGTDKYESLKKEYAVKQDASNAEIELNGAIFEGSSNTFTINGLTITAKEVSDSTLSLVTETDVDAVYDKIVDFISQYNEVINAMDSAYNADSSKGYEPLTDDEKESMSDKEVEKWEQKIKDSLLRRDSTLNSIASSMKMAMAKSYTINGKSYSLSSFGINTLGYFVSADNEKNAYHIDGNSKDESAKSNTDRLKAAIASDPDTVATFFNELAKGVYSELDSRMKTTTLSSAYKVYNDKQLKSEYDDYTEQIKNWETKLSDMEDYYYKKFSSMETALSKLNSQQTQLSGLLGS